MHTRLLPLPVQDALHVFAWAQKAAVHLREATRQTTQSPTLQLRGGFVRCLAINAQEGIRKSHESTLERSSTSPTIRPPNLHAASGPVRHSPSMSFLPVAEALWAEEESAKEETSDSSMANPNGIRVLGIRGAHRYRNELRRKAPSRPSRTHTNTREGEVASKDGEAVSKAGQDGKDRAGVAL